MRGRVMRVVMGIALCFALAGCAVIPTLEEDGVAISDIVQRVKCELAYAVPNLSGRYPSGDYQWMKYWTAKVDLTLDVTDNSSVKPNSSYTSPVTHGTFTIGVGGELSNMAQRTEKLSFTVSMKELVENRNINECLLPYQLGLLGNLGLEQWVASALAPAENGQLTIGFHQPPSGKPASIPIVGPSVNAAPELNPPPAKALLTQATTALKTGERGVALATSNADRARALALKSKFQATYDAVNTAYGYVEATTKQLDKASNLAWQAAAVDRDATVKLAGPDSDYLKKIPTAAKDAGDQVAKAKATATAAWELLPRDAPLDSIAHTAKFIVTLGGNVTPNWSLIMFKGPGLTTPFASASRVRTNQLDVVLGMPAVAGGKTLSDEQNRQLFNIQLDALRRSLVVIQ